MNSGLLVVVAHRGLCVSFHPYVSGPARGPPVSAAPPVSAPQPYTQYSHSQGHVQNGPPLVTQAPPRYYYRTHRLFAAVTIFAGV